MSAISATASNMLTCVFEGVKMELNWMGAGQESLVTAVKEYSGDPTVVHTINLHNNRIHYIEGLERFSCLVTLNLSSNSISHISGLESLVSLQKLNLSANEITKVSGLGNLHNLRSLILSYNRLTSLEGIDSLAGSANSLTFLDVRGNALNSLSNAQYLADCVHLKELVIATDARHNPKLALQQNYRAEFFAAIRSLVVLDGYDARHNRATEAVAVSLSEVPKGNEYAALVDQAGATNSAPTVADPPPRRKLSYQFSTPLIDQALARPVEQSARAGYSDGVSGGDSDALVNARLAALESAVANQIDERQAHQQLRRHQQHSPHTGRGDQGRRERGGEGRGTPVRIERAGYHSGGHVGDQTSEISRRGGGGGGGGDVGGASGGGDGGGGRSGSGREGRSREKDHIRKNIEAVKHTAAQRKKAAQASEQQTGSNRRTGGFQQQQQQQQQKLRPSSERRDALAVRGRARNAERRRRVQYESDSLSCEEENIDPQGVRNTPRSQATKKRHSYGAGHRGNAVSDSAASYTNGDGGASDDESDKCGSFGASPKAQQRSSPGSRVFVDTVKVQEQALQAVAEAHNQAAAATAAAIAAREDCEKWKAIAEKAESHVEAIRANAKSSVAAVKAKYEERFTQLVQETKNHGSTLETVTREWSQIENNLKVALAERGEELSAEKLKLSHTLNELDKTKSLLAQVQSEVADLKAERTKLGNHVSNLEAEKADAVEAHRMSVREYKVLVREKSGVESQLAELRSELDMARKEFSERWNSQTAQHAAELKEILLRESHARARAEDAARAKESENRTASALHELEAECRRMKSEFESRVAELRAKLQEASKEREGLAKKLAEARERESISHAHAVDLEALVSEQKKRLVEIAQQGATKAAELQEQVKQLQNRVSEAAGTGEKAQSLETQVESLKGELRAKSLALEGLQAEREEWSRQLANQSLALFKEKTELCEKVESLESAVSKLRDEIKVKDTMLKDQNETIASLRKELKHKELLVEETNRLVADADDKAETAEEEVQRLEEKLEAVVDAMARRTRELDNERERAEGLESAVAGVKAMFDARVAEFDAALVKAENERDGAREEARRASGRVRNLEAKLVAAAESLSEMQEDLRTERGRTAAAKARIEQTEDEMRRLVALLDEERVAHRAAKERDRRRVAEFMRDYTATD